jgi:hypothetical protein
MYIIINIIVATMSNYNLRARVNKSEKFTENKLCGTYSSALHDISSFFSINSNIMQLFVNSLPICFLAQNFQLRSKMRFRFESKCQVEIIIL